IPVIFVKGIAGLILKDLAYTITFALFISLVMALTLVPVLCSKFLRLQKGSVISQRVSKMDRVDLEISLADLELQTGNKIFDRLASLIQRALVKIDEFYERALNWAVRHSLAVIATAIILLAISISSIILLGMEFLPETDEAQFSINIETKIESPYTVTEEKVKEVENLIIGTLGPELDSLSSIIGRSGGYASLSEKGSPYARITVNLVNKDLRKRSIWQIVNFLTREIKNKIVDINFFINIEGMASLASTATGETKQIAAEIAGDNLEESSLYAEKIAGIIAGVKGTRDVAVSYKTGKPEIQFQVKRREAVSLGLSPLEIAATIRTAYNGTEVSRFKRNDDTYDIYVLLKDADRNSLSQMRKIFFINPQGTKILLENVVDIQEAKGPVVIERKNKTRLIKVTASLTGERPLNRVMQAIEKEVDAMGSKPMGLRLEFTGSSKQMGESFRDLFLALLIGAGLVYVIMASQFESLLHPFIIMFAIPFASIGLVFALMITNTSFSIVAFIGAILLVGYVVNNAIVLVDYMNILQRHGLPLEHAVVVGGKTRLKPVLMSTMTTMLGLIPMALGIGTGAELRAPMARAVLGGLSTSTLITLILIPTIYWLVESRLRRKVKT
ncbi:MAG: efflux RND transporter permease subunit, partial [Spirochaetota bacterium]